MQSMASGDPVDLQREKRWPNQTVSGVQVSLKPWQEDSDYSDEEGIFESFQPIQTTPKEVAKPEEMTETAKPADST